MYHMYLYVGITLEGTFTLSVVYLRLLFQLCTSHVSTEAARFLFLLFLKCCCVAVLFIFLFSFFPNCVQCEPVYFGILAALVSILVLMHTP